MKSLHGVHRISCFVGRVMDGHSEAVGTPHDPPEHPWRIQRLTARPQYVVGSDSFTV